jgi:hypothetical protein
MTTLVRYTSIDLLGCRRRAYDGAMRKLGGSIVVLALVALGSMGATCDSGGTHPPVYDLSYNPFLDLSRPAVSTPKCTPPGTVSCPNSGQSFHASPTVSGCFDNGTTPPNEIMSPIDNPSGPCPSTDNVVSCDTPPSCSFCLKNTAAIPVGCYKM